MLLESLSALHGYAILGFITAIFLSRGLHNKYGHRLNHIPGPFLAGLTDYWRLLVVWGRRPEVIHRQLHEKYGDLVRIGPQMVLVADLEAVKKIYALNAGYIKVGITLTLAPDATSKLTIASSYLVGLLPRTAEYCKREAASQPLQYAG